MNYFTRRSLGPDTILHRGACGQVRQFASSIATVSRVPVAYGPIKVSGTSDSCDFNSEINGPTPASAQALGPSNRACTRAHATNTTGNAPRSILGFSRPLDDGTVSVTRKYDNGFHRAISGFAQKLCEAY